MFLTLMMVSVSETRIRYFISIFLWRWVLLLLLCNSITVTFVKKIIVFIHIVLKINTMVYLNLK